MADVETRKPRTLQITGRLTSAERAAFDLHAREFGLDAAGLLVLLLFRELRVARLETLAGRHTAPTAGLDSKVTAHVRDAATRTGIRARAKCAGVSVSRACAVLVRTELAERWLERAMRLDSSREGIEDVI